MSDLVQLIYSSRPFGFDESTLNGILLNARHNNRRRGVTGALICRFDIYLQLIEGPEEAIEATFSRIATDNRHTEVRRCATTAVTARLFPEWDMRDDPVQSWMWSAEEVQNGAAEAATRNELLAIFARVASEPRA